MGCVVYSISSLLLPWISIGFIIFYFHCSLDIFLLDFRNKDVYNRVPENLGTQMRTISQPDLSGFPDQSGRNIGYDSNLFVYNRVVINNPNIGFQTIAEISQFSIDVEKRHR